MLFFAENKLSPSNNTFDWSEKPTLKLKELWKAGKSASEIAGVLNATFGDGTYTLTRNGVIGKLHRMKLTRTGGGRPAKPLQARTRPIRDLKPTNTVEDIKPSNVRVRTRTVSAKNAVAHARLAVLQEDKVDHDPAEVAALFSEGTFVSNMTFLERAVGRHCVFPHPDDKPSSSMRVCGCEVERKGDEYCAHHKRSIYGAPRQGKATEDHSTMTRWR